MALFAFGLAPRLFTLALISGAIVLTGYLEWKFTGLPRSVLEMIGFGVVGVLGFVATIVAIVLVLQVIRAISIQQSITRPVGQDRFQDLQRYTSAYGIPRSHIRRQLIIAGLVIILVVVLATLSWALYAAGLLVGLAGSLIIATGLLVSVLIYINRFRRQAFGLVPGMTPQRQRTLLDVMAAVPKPTVEKSLVPWLNDCLNALAGLPQNQVLRFGHLWSGWDYHIKRRSPSPVDRDMWQQMSREVDHRLINLELMTTDLTRQRPFRFPMEASESNDPEQLWVCVDKLREGGGSNLFMPREIIASLALRGALAGARLRTRFSNDKQWDRFRWLRLRTALSNLEQLRGSTFQRRGFYADVLGAETWLDTEEAEFCEQRYEIPIDWYRPYHSFWPKAARLLDTFADAYRPSDDRVDVMTYRAPHPEPMLRQVPKE